MHASSIIAAALLALAPAVQAVGSAHIYNKCDFDMYLWSVSVGVFDGPTKLSANTGKYSQQYKTLSEGGVSMKLSKTLIPDKIVQFEYTYPGNNMFWYDLSMVDCKGEDCPCQAEGMYMESGPGCPTVTCEAGNATCGNAYTLFNDDWASKACSPSEDTSVYLCAQSADGSSSSASASASSGSSSSSSSSSSSGSSDDSDSDSSASAYASAGSGSKKGFIGASSPDSSSSSSAAPEPSKNSDNNVAVAEATAEASDSTPTSSYSAPTLSVALTSEAPDTTAPPTQNYVETTLITYVTQYSTAYVNADAHADYHKNKRAPIHPHARRHQHH